jgi:hypothetical protein
MDYVHALILRTSKVPERRRLEVASMTGLSCALEAPLGRL